MKIYKRILYSFLIFISVNLAGALMMSYLTLDLWWVTRISDATVAGKVLIIIASLIAVGAYLDYGKERHEEEQQ